MPTIKSHRRFESFFPPLFILLFFVFVFRDLLHSPMMAMMDLPAFPLGGMSGLQMRNFVSAWQSQGLGRAIDFDYRELFLAALAVLLRDNGELTQKVYYLSLLPIASLSMYYLLQFVGVRSGVARVIGGLAYGINPIAIGQFSGAPGQLVTIALLPLLLVGALEVAERRETRWRGMLLLAATLAVITAFNPYFPLIIAPLILLVWGYGLLLAPKVIVVLPVTIAYAVSLALSFVLTLPATLPTLTLVTTSSQEASVSAFIGDSLPTLVNQMQLCYSGSTPLQLFRMTGNPCTLDSWLGYSQNLFWTQLGLMLPIVSFGVLVWLPADSSRRRYVLFFSVIALLVILSAWLVHLNVPLSLFKRFQFLFLLRNPVKITMLLPLSYGPLIGFAVDGLRGLTERLASCLSARSRAGMWVIAGTCLVGSFCLAEYNWPIVTGDLGLSRLFGDDYSVPSLYYKANDWMSQRRRQDGFFRTLWLPFDHYTQVRLSSDSGGVSAIDEESGVTNSANLQYVNFVLTSLCQQKTSQLGALLAPANVKYVVVDLTSSQTGKCHVSGLEPYGAPAVFTTLLAGQSDLKEMTRDQNWVVFENEEFVPHLAVFDQAVLVPSLTVSSWTADTNSADKPLIIFADSPWLTSQNTQSIAFLSAIASSQGNALRKGSSATENQLRVTQVSDTEYSVNLKTGVPIFIFFGESYHPQWNAYYPDGKPLPHFPAFYYGNGFYIDRTGDVQIRLVFDRQPARNFQILVSAIAWVCVGIGLMVLSLRRIRQRFRGSEQR